MKNGIGYPIINNKDLTNIDEFQEIISPITNKCETRIALLSKEDINNVFINADKVFNEKWKNSSISLRIKILYEWIENIKKMKNEIVNAMFYEIAKNKNDSISEINRSINLIQDTIKSFYNLKDEAYSGDKAGQKKYMYYKRIPLGVVLCISPFNYPINLAVSKICPAIITGNTVVFKSASQASLTSYLLSKALTMTSIPDGVFSFITGAGKEIGDLLVSNPKIKLINFTGSTHTGQDLFKKSHFCNYILELGGNSAAIVLKDADIEKAAKSIVKGAFSYNGQRCTAIKRVICENSIKNSLISKIIEYVKELKFGYFNTCDITPIINVKSKNYIMELISDSTKKGGKILLGGESDNNLISPTVINNVSESHRIFSEEQFGPVLPIMSVNDLDHDSIIEIINNSDYGLQCSLFTNDINYIYKFFNNVVTGTLNINMLPERGPDYLPFLGTKMSGLNPQGIEETLKANTKLSGLVINYD